MKLCDKVNPALNGWSGELKQCQSSVVSNELGTKCELINVLCTHLEKAYGIF